MVTKTFSDDGLVIHIFGKDVLVTEPMKNYAIEKLSKTSKIAQQNVHMHCTLDIQKLDHHVSILMTFSHFTVKVEAITHDMYSAIDKATDKLFQALKKWKGKIQHHHHRPLIKEEAQLQVFEPYGDDELAIYNDQIGQMQKREYVIPKIVATKTHPIKTLTPSEAMMKLELSEDPFLVFRSEDDLKIKVMHRFPDGNYGLISPQT